MKYQTSLLTGEPVTIDVPDGTLTRPVRTSVLIDSGVELEVNAGAAEAADFYLDSTQTRLSGAVQLTGGLSLRTGALGGDPKAGLAYRVTTSTDEVLFGSAAPSTTLEGLARTLTAAGSDADRAACNWHRTARRPGRPTAAMTSTRPSGWTPRTAICSMCAGWVSAVRRPRSASGCGVDG